MQKNRIHPASRLLLVALALCVPGWAAEDSVPIGTILPVALTSTLNTQRLKPGQAISAIVMQDVPASNLVVIPARSVVLGHVIDVTRPIQGSGAHLTLQFDSLLVSKRRVAITVSLRAMASMMDIAQAQIPEPGASDNPWTTVQVGGEIVYRSDGPVVRNLRVVGEPVPNGVLVQTSGPPGSKCQDGFDGSDRRQALWVFSSDACGLYGMRGTTLLHAGGTRPFGQLELTSDQGDLIVRAGSGLLLRVIEPAPEPARKPGT